MPKLFLFIVLNFCTLIVAIGSTFTAFTEAEKKMIANPNMIGPTEAERKAFAAKFKEARNLIEKAVHAYMLAFGDDEADQEEAHCEADPGQVYLVGKDLHLAIEDKRRGLQWVVYNLDTKKIAPVIAASSKP